MDGLVLADVDVIGILGDIQIRAVGDVCVVLVLGGGGNDYLAYFVWVVNGGKAVKREITIIGETAQGVQVGGGLSAGDQLIVSGQQKVSNGMSVEIVK